MSQEKALAQTQSFKSCSGSNVGRHCRDEMSMRNTFTTALRANPLAKGNSLDGRTGRLLNSRINTNFCQVVSAKAKCITKDKPAVGLHVAHTANNAHRK